MSNEKYLSVACWAQVGGTECEHRVETKFHLNRQGDTESQFDTKHWPLSVKYMRLFFYKHEDFPLSVSVFRM